MRNVSLTVAVLAFMFCVAGCTGDESDPVDPPPGDVPEVSEAAATDKKPQEKIWETWSKPKLALMLTTEMHGYFEPCGCTSNQLGGMSRRADLRKKMLDAGWTVRGLDVGGLSRRSVRQSQIKFETTLAALRALGYAAIGIGPEELQLQPDFLLSQHIVEGETPLYFLCANLVFYDAPELGTPASHHVFEANGVKVGVTSVLSNSLKSDALPHPDMKWTPPADVLPQVLKEFDSQNVDLRVLLSQGSVEESKSLAEQFPDFDVVLTAEGVGDPDPSKPPQKIGNTLLIESGTKGKYVGVLGYSPEDENPFQYKLVSLERSDFDDTDAMIDLMQNYQTRLQEEEIVVVDGVSAPHPSGATFVGAKTCGECHTKALEIWEKTPHAHALESLDPSFKHAGFERLNGVNRTRDPECLACHVTGWDPLEYIRYQSGFLNSEFARNEEEKQLHALLAGSQCENCHGPGSRHIELLDSDVEAAKAQVRVTRQQAQKGMCEKCHDADNSPQFKFDDYWKRVEHYGLE